MTECIGESLWAGLFENFANIRLLLVKDHCRDPDGDRIGGSYTLFHHEATNWYPYNVDGGYVFPT